MKYQSAIYSAITFFIISTAIAINSINVFTDPEEVEPPIVSFTINDTDVCSGDSVSFTSSVEGEGSYNYSWNFGDGSTSNRINPTHTYTSLGCGNEVFMVTLTVTDEDDSSITTTFTDSVTVKQAPDVSFGDFYSPFSPFDNCGVLEIDYEVVVENTSNSHSCVTSYNIDWGDGNSENNVSFPASHTYTRKGSFNMVITAIGENGCTSQKTYLVKNSSNPTGGLVTPGSTTRLCLPVDPIEFEISNWGENPPDTMYNIDFGDGNITSLSQSQLEASTHYNATNPGASANYPIPHEYTESNCPSTHYTVLLDIETSCGTSNFTVGPIEIYQKPEVSFEVPETACLNQNIQIDNTSDAGFGLNCSRDLISWYWDMGDGTTYSSFEPIHSYSDPGNYTISLHAQNYCGTTEVITKEICIEAPLEPEFTADTIEGCGPFTTTLSNTTNLDDLCSDATFEWVITYTSGYCGTEADFEFVNGTGRDSEISEIEFINPGTYQIRLKGTSPCGTNYSDPKEVIVKAPPKVNITAIDDVCHADPTVITPTATVNSCSPEALTYNWSVTPGTSPQDWEFVNGTDETSERPEINFHTPGNYILSLEVTNSCGTTTDTVEFEVLPVPIITNSELNQVICSGTYTEEIIFEPIDPEVSYTWTGSSLTNNVSGVITSGTSSEIPSHELILTNGASGTVVYKVWPYLVEECHGEPVEFTITVNEGPSITAHPIGASYCKLAIAVPLSFDLSDVSDAVPSYQWYYNDTGITDPSDPNTTEIAAPEGTEETYTPPTNEEGTLYYFCVISFSGTGSCNELITDAVAIEVVPNVTIDTEEPLTQTLCSGATPEDLNFTISDGTGTITYQWYMSDTTIDGLFSPIAGATNTTYNPGVLNTPGTYYYYAEVSTDASLGCEDTFTQVFEIEVVEDPLVEVLPLEQTICTNAPAAPLIATVTGGIDSNGDGVIDNEDYDFQWYRNGVAVLAPEGTSSTLDHDSTLPAGTYEYHVEISRDNGLDCNATSDTVTITVIEGPSIATQPEDASYCIDGTATELSFVLSGDIVGATSYQWYYNDTGVTDPSDPNTTEIASPEGTQATYIPPTDTEGTLYYFCVVSFSGAGSCSEVTTQVAAIEVVPNVEINGEAPLTQTLCSGATPEDLSFNVTGGTGTITYQWYMSDTAIDGPFSPIAGATNTTYNPGVLNTPSTYYYYATVEVDAGLGCSDVDTVIFEIEIVENPEVEITPIEDQTICTNSSAQQLIATVTGGVDFNEDGVIDNDDYDFQWYRNGVAVLAPDGTSSTLDHDTTLPVGEYEYYVEISQPNDLDCNAISNTLTITVIEGPTIATQPEDASYCIDGTAELLTIELAGDIVGTISYQWYFNDTGIADPTDPNTTEISAPEGTQETYTPPTNAEGTLYYFCVISFDGAGSCDEVITNAAAIEVAPNVTIDFAGPLTQTLCSGATPEDLSFTISGGTGTITYQWYTSNDGVIDASDSPIAGATNTTYNPGILDTPGTYYYYATVEVDADLGCSDVDTAVFEIEIVENPEVEITPIEDQTVCTNSSAQQLIATVTGGVDFNENGVIDNDDYDFQWYVNGVAVLAPEGTSSTLDHDTTLPVGDYEYYVEISQPNDLDCEAVSNTVTITVIEGPTIATQPEDASYCIDGTAELLTIELAGDIVGTISYQWYFNDTGIADPTDPNTTEISAPEGTQETYTPPTNAEGTLYYFCVISFDGAGSCDEVITNAAAIEVVPNVIIDTEGPLTQTLCSGATPEDLSFTISGGTGTISYQWFTSEDGVIDASGSPIVGATNTTYNPGVLDTPGTYYYYAEVSTDASLGCEDTYTQVFEIKVVPNPEVAIAPIEDQTICTDASAELLVATATGGVDFNEDGVIDNDDYDFQWYRNGVAVPAPEGTSSTLDHDTTLPASDYSYYVEISQPNDLDCNAISNTVTITVNEGPSIATQPVGATYCLGDMILDLEVEVINGVGEPTYQWYANDTNDMDTPTPVGTNSNVLIIPNTDVSEFYYYCIITFSEGGCGSLTTDIVPIIIHQVPEISDYTAVICSDNSFVIIPDNTNGDIVPENTMYTWPTPTVIPAGAITGASEENTPVSTISQSLENTTDSLATVTYIVTPMTEHCEGEPFEVVVTVNPSIAVESTVVNNNCFESNDASIEISISGGVPFAGNTPYNIIWTGPNGFTSTDENLFNLEAGSYQLEIMDDGDCVYTESFTITEPDELVFSSIQFDPETISCFGADDGTIGIEVEGGTLPYDYTWTKDGVPFSSDQDLSDLGPGNYEVSVTDANNCGPITQSFLIEEPLLLEVLLEEQTNVFCYGDATGAIDINVVGGRPGYTFSWTGPNGFTSADQNISDLIAGTYTIVVTDSSDCVDTLDFEVTQNDEITIDVSITEIECYGANDGVIAINAISGGVAPYDISWSNFGTGMIQSNLSPGIYTITITDAVGCSMSFAYEIEEAPLFLIEPEITQLTCYGANDARIVLNFQGGMDPITVEWSDDSTAGVERNSLGPGTYTVTIIDGTPCVIQESFIIYEVLPLELSANITHAFDCDNTNSGAINLLITGGTAPYDVAWSNGATTEDLEDIPPNTYYVTVTDANGCQVEGSWSVNRFDPLTVDVQDETIVDCDARLVQRTFVASASGGVPPFQYNWSSGTVSGPNNNTMRTSTNGLIVLEVVDSQGCTTNYTFNVEVPELGDADFDYDSFGISTYGFYSILDPIQFVSTATGDYESVSWDFGDGTLSNEENPIHTYSRVGTYVVTLTVTYPFGCVYTKSITLKIGKGYELIMPNAFTPNNDGINDYFGPEQIGLSNLEFYVYDTWGSLIYSESGDFIRGWNGRIKSEDAQNGNYYYIFRGRTFYNEVLERTGPFKFIK